MKRAFLAFLLALPLGAAAQEENYRSRERQLDRPARQDRQIEQRKRAIERCKADRGIDCDTKEGLEEWLLQERSRQEAVSQGSRVRGSSAIFRRTN